MSGATRHRRGQQYGSPPMTNSVKMSQVLNSSNFEELKCNKRLAMQCESLLQAGRLTWFEEFPWLEYRIPLDVLYCKYCAKTTSSGSLAVGRKPDKTRRIDLIVHAQTDMHINIMHHFQEGKEGHSNIIYISSNSKFCNQKKVHIKAVSIVDDSWSMSNGSNHHHNQGMAVAAAASDLSSIQSPEQQRPSIKIETSENLNGMTGSTTDSMSSAGLMKGNGQIVTMPKRMGEEAASASSHPVVVLGTVMSSQKVHPSFAAAPGMSNQLGHNEGHSLGGTPMSPHVGPSPLHYHQVTSSQDNQGLMLTWSSICDIAKNDVQRKRVHSILLRHKIKEDWFNEFEWLEMNLSQMKFYCKYCRVRGTNSTLARGKSVAISKSKRNDFIIHAETDSHRNVMQSYKDGSWKPPISAPQHTVAELLHERRVSVESTSNSRPSDNHLSSYNSQNKIQPQPGLVMDRNPSISPSDKGPVVNGSQVIVIEPSERQNQENLYRAATENSVVNLALHSDRGSDYTHNNGLDKCNVGLSKGRAFSTLEVAERISPSLVEITKIANASFINGNRDQRRSSASSTNRHEITPPKSAAMNSPTARRRTRSKEQFINLCDSPEDFDSIDDDNLPGEEALSLVVGSVVSSSTSDTTNSPKECADIVNSAIIKLSRRDSSSNLSDLCNEMLSSNCSEELRGCTPTIATTTTATVSKTTPTSRNMASATKTNEQHTDVLCTNTDLVVVKASSEESSSHPLPVPSISPNSESTENRSYGCRSPPLKNDSKAFKTFSALASDDHVLPSEQEDRYVPFHNDVFWRELNRFRQTGSMCDVTLAALSSSGELVKCYGHKLILSTASSYFKHLFTTSSEEEGEGGNSALLFPNLTPGGLKGVVDYLYGEPVRGSPEYYKACYRAACVLGVSSARVVFRGLMSAVCPRSEVFTVTMGLPSQSVNNTTIAMKSECSGQSPNTCSSSPALLRVHREAADKDDAAVGSSKKHSQGRRHGQIHLKNRSKRNQEQRTVRTSEYSPDSLYNRKEEADSEVVQNKRLDDSHPGTGVKRKRPCRSVSAEEDDGDGCGQCIEDHIAETVQQQPQEEKEARHSNPHSTGSSNNVVVYKFSRLPPEMDMEASNTGNTNKETHQNSTTRIAKRKDRLFKTIRLKCYMCRGFVAVPVKYASTELSKPREVVVVSKGEGSDTSTETESTALSNPLCMKGNKKNLNKRIAQRRCYVRCRFCTDKLRHGFVKTCLGKYND